MYQIKCINGSFTTSHHVATINFNTTDNLIRDTLDIFIGQDGSYLCVLSEESIVKKPEQKAICYEYYSLSECFDFIEDTLNMKVLETGITEEE